ncbi:MAG: Histidine kinase, gyrase and HSP90-like ATPase [Phenylobacterium sp.]|nr:Histidine kinase, gyrase and HSP90-like ATPase [Phenylobacterium sp.]
MSDLASSAGAGSPSKAPAQGANLFAASARNMIPRLVSSLALAAVGACYVGPGWTLLWLLAVWAGLLVGLRLTGAAGPARSMRAITANSIVGTLVQVAMLFALWRNGDQLVGTFALTCTFVSAAYVLLQYYSDLRLFRLLLTPYAALMLYMGVDLAMREGLRGVQLVVAAAGLVTVVNFFYLARRQLDRSRTVLRVARHQAQQGEFAAESANTAKSAFLATMSHEIRTPLNGVLGMTQAMAADELSEVQRDRLSVIHRSGEALLAILNDVLDLSKIEAGKLELETIEFDLGELAQGAYSAFTALANKKGLSFALDIAQARGRYLGDPTRIRQILYNLISNALKFTDQGEIRVTARHDGAMLEIAVADTGVGISPDNLVRLFQKFDQLDSSTTRRYGGTGLGLAICHDLGQLMGGEIAVESRVGEGSRFIVRLPLPMIGEERTPPQLAPAPVSDLKPMRLRVLAAEDNAVNQLVLKTLLHQLGLDPTVVEDGAAAVAAWAAGEWDVILMDVQMPVMDGLTATTTIRDREAETGRSRTPIIALTANAMSHQVEQYLAAGMDGHVAKPIAAADLFQALSAVIEDPQDAAAAEVA